MLLGTVLGGLALAPFTAGLSTAVAAGTVAAVRPAARPSER